MRPSQACWGMGLTPMKSSVGNQMNSKVLGQPKTFLFPFSSFVYLSKELRVSVGTSIDGPFTGYMLTRIVAFFGLGDLTLVGWRL